MRLPLDAAYLGSFGRQIVNQALLIEDESDYWTVDPIRVTIGHSKISRDFRIAPASGPRPRHRRWSDSAISGNGRVAKIDLAQLQNPRRIRR